MYRAAVDLQRVGDFADGLAVPMEIQRPVPVKEQLAAPQLFAAVPCVC